MRQLIIRLAVENSWRDTRSKGELLKLGHVIGRSTVQRILKNEGIPDLYHRKDSTWHQFIQREMATLWACDFFCQPVYGLLGKRYVWVLVFINLGTRRVHYSGCTEHPHSAWVEQKARQFCWHLNDQEEFPKFLLRDRDGKFAGNFDAIIESEKIEIKRLPVKAPNLNAWIESWIASLKRECLNHFFVMNERHLDYLVREYVTHYNTERPHQSKDKKPLVTLPISNKGEVFRKQRLGGLLNHYYRKAA